MIRAFLHDMLGMQTDMSNHTTSPSVLFVDQSGEMGGAEHSLFDIIDRRPRNSRAVLFSDGPFREHLQAAGIAVDVLPLGQAGNVERNGKLAAAALGTPALMRAVLRLAKKARAFDVVYANTQKSFVVAALAAMLARRPLIWHLRDILTADHFSAGLRKIVVILANRCADCIIANSQATANAFKAAGGTARIHVVHNGIDPSPFDAIDSVAAKHDLRSELRVDATAPLVGVFSRLAQWKGQHVLVDALRELPQVHAVFVGGALFGEETYQANLRQQAIETGVDERCHFLGFRSDVPVLMHAVDVVAHTSISPEPFGRVVVEGMLSGNPVIAARGGGVLEIIEDDKTGLLVAPGDASELRSAIHRLTSDADHASALAQRGNRAAREKFSLDACLDKIETIILDLSASAPASRAATAPTTRQ